MSKPFFEVFPSLQLNTDIRDLMGQTEVERVSATKRRDFLRVYLKSTRLIQKADIWTTEQEIKKQLFPQANLTVKIYEKFELSSQYNPEKLMDIYKESILEEFREYSHIQYNALKTAKIEYPSENEMLLTLEDTVLNHSIGRQFTLYSAYISTAQNIDQMIECLSLTQKQSVILHLRLSGYGFKAISTYLGITSEAARSTMKGVQKKAISALQLPDYLIEQLQTVNHNNKLTNNDKATIKQMFDDGYTMAYIAEQFNVSKMTISRVINGRKDRQVGK